MTTDSPRTGRSLPIWGFILLVVVYLAIIQSVPRLTSPSGIKYGSFPTTDAVIGGLWVTVGLGSLIGLIAVALLGWWRPAFVNDRRLPHWTWLFPGLMVLAIAVGTS